VGRPSGRRLWVGLQADGLGAWRQEGVGLKPDPQPLATSCGSAFRPTGSRHGGRKASGRSPTHKNASCEERLLRAGNVPVGRPSGRRARGTAAGRLRAEARPTRTPRAKSACSAPAMSLWVGLQADGLAARRQEGIGLKPDPQERLVRRAPAPRRQCPCGSAFRPTGSRHGGRKASGRSPTHKNASCEERLLRAGNVPVGRPSGRRARGTAAGRHRAEARPTTSRDILWVGLQADGFR
jgi:hypothetical protein